MLVCRGGSIYTGITNNLKKRLMVHQRGKGSKFVRSRLPFSLVRIENVPSRGAALKREAEIKSLNKKEKVDLLNKRGNRK